MEDVDTISAVSTPVGEGGIGIVRISGPLAHSILKNIFRTKRKRESFKARQFYLGNVVDPDSGSVLDEVLAVFMYAPHTYTREDVAEIHSHSGFAVLRSVLDLTTRFGARLAKPGEFTERAFLNGRLDLLQAESVLDIIESETDEELQCALNHLRGGLSAKIGGLKEGLMETLVEVEALIDFPEEEIDVEVTDLVPALKKIGARMERLTDSYYQGRAVKHGYEVLIVGRTNVGKSSLLNALLARERAIVTPLPGTTRDMIEDVLHIKGIKIRIIDTAGIRRSEDIVEKEGVSRVKQRISEVDLVLLVLDGSEAYGAEDEAVLESVNDAPVLVVVNKIDLPRVLDTGAFLPRGSRSLEVSALKDMGLERLKDAIYHKFLERGGKGGKILITSMRQRDALARATESVKRAMDCITREEPLEFTAFELREALSYIGEITGETCTEEILKGIFERFCVGK
jgi:tRNA modification GTPase